MEEGRQREDIRVRERFENATLLSLKMVAGATGQGMWWPLEAG